jgi:SAM-dependent methyltransferase
MASRYVTADLIEPADLQIDIEHIPLPDGSFDIIICSHVLEHVDDHRAIAEIARVLSSSGIAILLVPIAEGWKTTYENAQISTPSERELHFGQSDHVRVYGADFRQRVRNCNLSLDEFTPDGQITVKYGLTRGETIFLARKE